MTTYRNKLERELTEAFHEARVNDVCSFIEKGIDRNLMPTELRLINKIPEQVLHLLSAAIAENAS